MLAALTACIAIYDTIFLFSSSKYEKLIMFSNLIDNPHAIEPGQLANLKADLKFARDKFFLSFEEIP